MCLRKQVSGITETLVVELLCLESEEISFVILMSMTSPFLAFGVVI